VLSSTQQNQGKKVPDCAGSDPIFTQLQGCIFAGVQESLTPCLMFNPRHEQVQGVDFNPCPRCKSSTVTVYSTTCQGRSSFGPDLAVKTQNSECRALFVKFRQDIPEEI